MWLDLVEFRAFYNPTNFILSYLEIFSLISFFQVTSHSPHSNQHLVFFPQSINAQSDYKRTSAYLTRQFSTTFSFKKHTVKIPNAALKYNKKDLRLQLVQHLAKYRDREDGPNVLYIQVEQP